MTGVVQRKVGEDEEGVRLDRWFKRHYPDLSHGRLEKLLRTGQVRVDGGRAKAADRLTAGQAIRVPPLGTPAPAAKAGPKPISAEEARDLDRLVLKETPLALILNKPAGLAVQGGTGTTRHLDGLLDHWRPDGGERPKLVHRLDRDTSGVLVLAKSAKAADLLGKAFFSRTAQKVYWALTVGVPKPLSGTIDLALAKLPGSGPQGAHERMVAVEDGDEVGQRALTDFIVLAHAGPRLALVALRPRTGRTHQLRAHMAAIHCPILGDGKYGGAASRLEGGPPAKLQLHARAIHIPLGRDGVIEAKAPPPEAFVRFADYVGLAEDLARAIAADPFAPFPDMRAR